MSRTEDLTEALKERDQILIDLDIDAAKAFILKHGGRITNQQESLNWLRIIHMARLECLSVPQYFRDASRMWLATRYPQRIGDLSLNSPYASVTLDLIFPRTMTDDYIEETKGKAP
jgi:hypothetical protein